MIKVYGLRFCQLWRKRDALGRPCYYNVRFTQNKKYERSLQMISASVPRVGARNPAIIVSSVVMGAPASAIHGIEITSSTSVKRHVKSAYLVTTDAKESVTSALMDVDLA